MQRDDAPEDLSRFQSRLLQLLWEETDPEKIRAALLADTALSPFHDYVENMEDRMITVACELVRKWGSS